MATSGFAPANAKRSDFPAPYLSDNSLARKFIVLGMDGLDPNLVRRFVSEGELPTFKRLIEAGHFGELQTTMPPQSPVAWSSFITGTDPGGHGIYDFIHRDPKSFVPYMSTSRSFDAKESVTLGAWKIPLGSGEVSLMRKGTAFWTELEAHGIPAAVYAIPGNFPVVPGASKSISGMGTPDLLGTYGTFTLLSEEDVPGSEKFAGGRVIKTMLRDHKAVVRFPGPKNSFRKDGSNCELELTIYRDPWEKALQLSVDGKELLLKQGEWSEWVPLRFELLPFMASVAGMVRFYVQQVHPTLKLYCSPLNVDPMEPSLPICTPDGYSRELSEAVGRFYTQGFPSDTKALSSGVLSDDEYLQQAKWVMEESFRLLNYQLSQFKEGFFYFYFSSTDQNQHMLLRTMDPSHPLYNPSASPDVKDAVRYFYRKMDEALQLVLPHVDGKTVLAAVSDHGFAPFKREVHLSTWLVENGFTVLSDPKKIGEGEFYQYVDWSRTRAYALGLNGIYVNLKDREKHGWVDPADAAKIKSEIVQKLSPLRDPLTDSAVVTKVYHPEEIYRGPFLPLAPDLVVGYQSGYRISDEAVLGKFPRGIIGDRTDKWSSDHCLDPAVVPGILLCNRRCAAAKPGLWDMAPSILESFGLSALPQMTGKNVLTA